MLDPTRRNGETVPARARTTPIARWDPWSEFNRLSTELDGLFTSLFGTAPRPVEGITTFTPAVDLYETAEELVVNAHLPGISREDLTVEVLADSIRIAGETRLSIPEIGVTVHQTQGRYGKFDVRYSLPIEIKAEQVKATYRNGVLEVRLPKVEAVRPKPVEVRVEG
jgi:HSP20 family protein